MSRDIFLVYSSADEDLRFWDHYFGKLDDKGIYHAPRYIKVLESYVGHAAELFVYEDETGFVYYPYFKRDMADLPFMHGREDLVAHPLYDIVSSWYYGGPLIHCRVPDQSDRLVDSFIQCFHEYCQKNGIICEFIRFDPNLENFEFFHQKLPFQSNRETVYVDLQRSPQEIWKGVSNRSRTYIRKAKTNGVSVEPSDLLSDMDAFCTIYCSEMDRKSAMGHYRFDRPFFHKLQDRLRGNLCLLVAKLEGEIIGGILCLYDDTTVYDFLMASLPDYLDTQVNKLLMYEAICWAKEDRFHSFDLQGGREGVFKFKRIFSPLRRTFYTASIVHDAEWYQKLCISAEEHGSLGDGSYFPAYRQRASN